MRQRNNPFACLFPQACLLCGAPVLFECAEEIPDAAAIPVCRSCHCGLRPIEGRRCARCSQPLTSEEGLCLRCRERELSFEANWSPFAYEDEVRELVYQYKFRNQRRLARYFAFWLARGYQTRYPGLPLVPVPFRPSGRRRRGWDHVECILSHLARTYHIPPLPLLARDDGPQQKRLDFEGRMGNLRGRIRLREGRGGPLSEGAFLRPPRAVVLLDDILTTGATASECARLLREAGVATVFVLTIAIA